MLLSKQSKKISFLKPWTSTNYVKTFSALKEVPVQNSKSEPKIQPETVRIPEINQNIELVPKKDTANVSLVEKKESAEVLLNADPFDEVPGPEILRKISSVWKYLPVAGSQATVSALLSFFKLAQIGGKSLKILGGNGNRPFTKLFEKYGPVVKLQGPLGSEIVLLSRPEHIAKIYDQEGRYPIRPTLDSVERCRSPTRKNCGGPFNLSGAEWEEIRKAIDEPLSRGGEKYFPPIEEAGTLITQRIRSLRNRQNEVQGDLMLEIKKWSLECLCYVTLNKSLGFLTQDSTIWTSESARLLKSINDATDCICKCESGFQFWRLMNTPSLTLLTQSCEIIDGILSKHIRQAHMNLTKKKDDLITGKNPKENLTFIESMLLNECMTPDEVLTSTLDVLLIGVNTTSSALGFVLYHLARNQRAQRTLFKEVKEFLPERRSRLKYNQMQSLRYLQACLKESLRLKMPMPILTRILPSDIALSNFRIPKGAYMVMDAQAAGLREQDFEKAEKFVPERWLEPENIHPFASIPFGHGPRSCVGKTLAEIQLGSCLAKIIRNFQIEYNYGEIHATDNVISFPDKPLRLSFIERDE